MKFRHLILLAAALTAGMQAMAAEPAAKNKKKSAEMSFVLLGDMHYCDLKYYDLDNMLKEKPGDHRQITKSYAPVCEANWNDQIAAIKSVMAATVPAVKGIVQLGDVSEGLANYEGAADAMAANIVNVLRNSEMGVPWILAKGNHDITGVGDFKNDARPAYVRNYTPFIREQVGDDSIEDATYAYSPCEDVLFVVIDAYNRKQDQVEFARKALSSSDAKYKFICLHEPIIPATERCWHYMKRAKPEERDELLKVIAENKAIVLCGHLHRYSVLRRNTQWGPIVQIMVNSVTNVKRSSKPGYQKTLSDYGPALADWKPDYSPKNIDWRREVLAAEKPFVDYYQMCPLAGMGVLSIDKKGKITLKYYPAFKSEPVDEVNISELLK